MLKRIRFSANKTVWGLFILCGVVVKLRNIGMCFKSGFHKQGDGRVWVKVYACISRLVKDALTSGAVARNPFRK
jgi:hypothetical protein